MSTLQCPSCSRSFSPTIDGRLPPWCPRCGADLKARPQPSSPPEAAAASPGVPTATPAVAPTVPVPSLPGPQLGYIQVRAAKSLDVSQAFYRLYVLEENLYFLRLGCPLEKKAPPSAVAAGALFGLVGALVVSAMTTDNVPRDEMAERARLLDLADEEALRMYIKEGDGSFVLAVKDVEQVRLGPVSFWRGLGKSAPQGLLQFTHAEAGELECELLSFLEVRKTRERLRPRFGDRFLDQLRNVRA